MSKKFKMKLNRKYRLASTLGHVIVFQKDEPIDVPEILVREAVDIGAEFVEESARDEVYKEDAPAIAQPVSPNDRRDAIIKAMDTLYERNDRDDFTATGNPTMQAIQAITGFKIDKAEFVLAMKVRNEDQ